MPFPIYQGFPERTYALGVLPADAFPPAEDMRWPRGFLEVRDLGVSESVPIAAGFVDDTFTDTNGTLLENHTGEVGASWSVHPSGIVGSLEIQGNHVERPTGDDTAVYLNNGAPSSPDYWVEAEVTRNNELGAVFPGIIGRADATAATFYSLRYDGASNIFRLHRYLNGSPITLGPDFTDLILPGGSRTMRLEMVGDQISVYSNDVLRFTVTNSEITAAGSAGIRWVGAGTGWEIDNFRAGM